MTRTDVSPSVDTFQREFKRAGREIRKWRTLFAAVVREVDHLRRRRRIAQRMSADRARDRQAQLKMLGVTSFDELILAIHHKQGWERLAIGPAVVAECETCIRKGLLPSKAIACYVHSRWVSAEHIRTAFDEGFALSKLGGPIETAWQRSEARETAEAMRDDREVSTIHGDLRSKDRQ